MYVYIFIFPYLTLSWKRYFFPVNVFMVEYIDIIYTTTSNQKFFALRKNKIGKTALHKSYFTQNMSRLIFISPPQIASETLIILYLQSE